MSRRQVLQAGTLVWAVAGAAVALGSLDNVNDDARLLVGIASIVGPLLSLGAAVQLGRHADRSAGVLLVLSALLTPTYFAYAINLPVLVVGAMLVFAGHWLLPQSADSHRPRSATQLKA